MKKLFSIILACAMLFSVVPAFATELPDNPDESFVLLIGTHDSMDTNAGCVDTNCGILNTNNGSVNENISDVDITKNGIIQENNGTVVNNGNETRYATVVHNSESGVIQENQGFVTVNDGLIIDSNDYGYVTTNNATIQASAGTVETNNNTVNENSGEITNNYGDVDTSSGYVINNYGTVAYSNGTITTNETGGTITTNAGEINENNGTVDVNNSIIYINGENGTIENCSEDSNVTYSYGTISENEGYILANLGTVDQNNGHIEHNSGTVTNGETGVVVTNRGTLIEYDGTIYYGLIATNTRGEDGIRVLSLEKDSVHSLRKTFKRKGYTLTGYITHDDAGTPIFVYDLDYTSEKPTYIALLWKKNAPKKVAVLFTAESQNYDLEAGKIEFKRTEGNRQIVSQKDFDASKVFVDGKEIDATMFTVCVDDISGNLVLHLEDAFIETLSAGNHDMKLKIMGTEIICSIMI